MKYFKWIIAGLLGGVAGFSYWYFIGCNTGSCVITSSPVNSSIYGVLMSVLFLNVFSGDRKNANQKDK